MLGTLGAMQHCLPSRPNRGTRTGVVPAIHAGPSSGFTCSSDDRLWNMPSDRLMHHQHAGSSNVREVPELPETFWSYLRHIGEAGLKMCSWKAAGHLQCLGCMVPAPVKGASRCRFHQKRGSARSPSSVLRPAAPGSAASSSAQRC